MQKIQVRVTNVYGNETVYPACETAKFFARLAGTKTLTRVALRLIKEHGYAIETVPVPVESF